MRRLSEERLRNGQRPMLFTRQTFFRVVTPTRSSAAACWVVQRGKGMVVSSKNRKQSTLTISVAPHLDGHVKVAVLLQKLQGQPGVRHVFIGRQGATVAAWTTTLDRAWRCSRRSLPAMGAANNLHRHLRNHVDRAFALGAAARLWNCLVQDLVPPIAVAPCRDRGFCLGPHDPKGAAQAGGQGALERGRPTCKTQLVSTVHLILACSWCSGPVATMMLVGTREGSKKLL